jgi:plastocyanin
MTDQTTNDDPAPAPVPDAHRETREGLFLPIVLPLGALAVIGLVLFGFSRVLLSVSSEAATAIALIVAISIMLVAIIAATRERLSNSSIFSMIGVVAGIAMLSGGIAIVATGASGKEGPKTQVVTLAAPQGAAVSGFQPASLSVASNEPIELDFRNQDPGIQHNVVIFGEDPANNPDAQALFTGSLVTGPSTMPYQVPPLPAGTFFFHCAVHPTTMTGTITSSEGGSGGGGPTVKAESLTFNTSEIDLTAGQPTTLTFDNEDAGIPHNIAIYTDDSLSKTLFQGEQFPGVDTREYVIPALDPGTYFFHCDVHPTMNGSVVVSAGGPAGGSGAASGSPPAATGGSSGSTGPSPSG